MIASLARSMPPHEELEEDLAAIEAAAIRAGDMVRQLLSFARGLPAHLADVDLAPIVADVERAGKASYLRGVDVRVEIATAPTIVLGDATQIHQLLTNLCINAADAMQGGGTLTLTVDDVIVDASAAAQAPGARPGRHLRITIADTGPGMTPEVVTRVFEPFFTTKEAGRGTGLGLAMVETIVRNHGGLIRVESEIGRGTRFVVSLPASGAPAAAVERRRRTQPQPADGEVVLVVDDEEAVRLAAVRILERAGYRAITAEHGAAAVAIYAARRKLVAAVVLDMTMPVLDGPATAAALRAMNPEVRIVATSGHPAFAERPQVDPSNLTAFVAKPYTAEALLEAVGAAVRRTAVPRP
jgi:CheY-like chemotaxis protein